MTTELSPFDVGKVFELSDGRQLGYVSIGNNSSSITAVYFHGLSGSRLEVLNHVKEVENSGTRLISVDRPGIGLSSSNSNGTLLSFGKDINELLDYLEISSVSLVAFSGGAPYALACAYLSEQSDHKVSSVALLSGLGPIRMIGTKDMMLANRIIFSISPYSPTVVSLIFWLFARNVRSRLENGDPNVINEVVSSILGQSSVQPSDKLLLQDLDDDERFNYLVGVFEAYRNGASGVGHDAYLISRDWGFNESDIKVPVYIYHGSDDVNVPFRMADYMCNKLSNAVLHKLDSSAHVSTRFHSMEKALTESNMWL
mmetsp:Transcript_403/g.478  ORF Transcript_403/g.478 Transcript_403/m.478 type:complete len:313 (-) Transcript_403:20-958(-)|eukprot:CAMPEP_0184026540 /NCGR_PEP_ID=MMETSP0954-20121128/13583_1 /TAXON_ID=627963 /ORGANISM="Aplanochytrium sp, Strain PBS07" /LENGTH=312 /DNA_ID=CAMNT_0026310767 /DNA_START=100 /DNA_END=1038 /DNA_ORIENTATION=-